MERENIRWARRLAANNPKYCRVGAECLGLCTNDAAFSIFFLNHKPFRQNSGVFKRTSERSWCLHIYTGYPRACTCKPVIVVCNLNCCFIWKEQCCAQEVNIASLFFWELRWSLNFPRIWFLPLTHTDNRTGRVFLL